MSREFNATTSLYNSLTAKPISHAKVDLGTKDAQDQTKYRTERAETTWVPRTEKEAAATDVSMLTKTAWHIGQGYNVGAGFAQQHGWDTLASNANVKPPRLYEYAGLTVRGFTKSSGPFMKGQYKEGRVADMLLSRKERHDRELSELDARVLAINESFDSPAVSALAVLKEKLRDDRDAIERAFLALADEFLTRIDMAQLQGVWSTYQDHSMLRDRWISDFAEQMEALESQRALLVEGELDSSAMVLLDLAHQNQGEVERLLEELADAQNKIASNNRRALLDMVARLRRTEMGFVVNDPSSLIIIRASSPSTPPPLETPPTPTTTPSPSGRNKSTRTGNKIRRSRKPDTLSCIWIT